MSIEIDTRFAFTCSRPTDVLLQFEAADIPEQRIDDASLSIPTVDHRASVAAQDAIGERIWLRAEGRIEVQYSASVSVNRQIVDLPSLAALSPHDMPGEAVQYLFDSRYCAGDKFQSFVETEFSGTSGGERIAAIDEWVANNFSYKPGVSDARTGSVDSFIERAGICRDYAHMVIALARASTIPARYVACYAPGVDPPDFHAVAEVFLNDPETAEGGTWQLVDATRMADPAETVKIGVGRDAADVSFLTSFGPAEFEFSEVQVRQGD